MHFSNGAAPSALAFRLLRDVYVAMCIDACVDMCVPMCVDMCADMCAGLASLGRG